MTAAQPSPQGQQPIQTRALIIGSGFSGMGMAIELQRRGVDFLILEKADEFGGTWRDNTYPGCACDIPSHMYSFSFEPKADWSHMWSFQPEIQDYLLGVASKYGLRRNTRFNTHVDRAHWDDQELRWHVFSDTGQEFIAQFLVSGPAACTSRRSRTSKAVRNSPVRLSIPRSGTTASTSPASGSQ